MSDCDSSNLPSDVLQQSKGLSSTQYLQLVNIIGGDIDEICVAVIVETNGTNVSYIRASNGKTIDPTGLTITASSGIGDEGSYNYTGTTWNAIAPGLLSQDIGSQNNDFWIIRGSGANDTEVQKYDIAGVTIGSPIALDSQQGTALIWNGSSFWVLYQLNSTVVEYDPSWVATGSSFSVAAEETLGNGLAWDGVDFWVCGQNTSTAYKYDSIGVYSGTSQDLSSEDVNPIGLTWDGTNFYMLGFNTSMVYEYDSSMVFTGVSFDVSLETAEGTGLAPNDDSLWVVSQNPNAVYQYKKISCC